MKLPCVYIMSSRFQGPLYIGVTSDLVQRVWQHKNDVLQGFTSRYQLHRLVYFERLGSMEEAIVREKRMKTWKRQWKVELIEATNPEWLDLYPNIL